MTFLKLKIVKMRQSTYNPLSPSYFPAQVLQHQNSVLLHSVSILQSRVSMSCKVPQEYPSLNPNDRHTISA